MQNELVDVPITAPFTFTHDGTPLGVTVWVVVLLAVVVSRVAPATRVLWVRIPKAYRWIVNGLVSSSTVLLALTLVSDWIGFVVVVATAVATFFATGLPGHDSPEA